MSGTEKHESEIVLNEGLRKAETHQSWHRYDEVPLEVLNDPETIRLDLSGGWQPIPDHILQASRQAVEQGYLRIQPVPEFNEAVAEKFRSDFGVVIDPVTEVIPCHGAGDGFFAALSVLLNPGDEVITFDPGFSFSYLIPTYLGATVKTIPVSSENNWIPDADFIASQLDQLLSPRTRAFILVNPDNPTGHVFRRELLERIAEKLQQNGIVVLEDQVYEKIIYPPNKFTPMMAIPAMRDKTISVSSFAKSYLCAGMKVGYVVAPPIIINALRHYYMLNSWVPNTAAQRAGAEILSGPQDFLHQWVREWDVLRHQTNDALNSIPGISCCLPEAGTYCLADVSKLGGGDEIADLLMKEARVLVTPGSWYGPAGKNFIRVCFGRTQPERIAQGLERTVETLTAVGRGKLI